jgi:hypothetical protein
MNQATEIHFLRDWQHALGMLPQGTAVYVVSGTGNRPREPEAVFLDHAAGTMWIARRPDPLDYLIEGFTVIRERNSELTYLRPGAPPVNVIDATIRKMNRRPLVPLPPDKMFKESQ